jgi:ABC-type transport system involved in cytochrome c biogenesis permease subunit
MNQKSASVWSYKPWWCQPWSILLTGVALISASWLLLKILWLTILVAIPVLTWMTFFLFLYPKLVMQSGVLDNLQPKD